MKIPNIDLKTILYFILLIVFGVFIISYIINLLKIDGIEGFVEGAGATMPPPTVQPTQPAKVPSVPAPAQPVANGSGQGRSVNNATVMNF
jgi:hypothetical protein